MAHKIKFGDKHWHLPKSRAARITIGVLLIFGGLLGFLPILGFWMIPLGVLVLSIDLHLVRRWRRRTVLRWNGRKKKKNGQDQPPGEA